MHECAAVAPRLNDLVAFQQSVGLRHGLAVKVQVVGQLSNRRQRITGAQQAAANCLFYLVNQLCEFSMLYAWSSEVPIITKDTIKSVLDDGVFFGGLSLVDDKQDLHFLTQRERVLPSEEGTG